MIINALGSPSIQYILTATSICTETSDEEERTHNVYRSANITCSYTLGRTLLKVCFHYNIAFYLARQPHGLKEKCARENITRLQL